MPGTTLCTRNTNNSTQNKLLTFTETIFVVEEDISKILKQIFNILCVRNRKKSICGGQIIIFHKKVKVSLP